MKTIFNLISIDKVQYNYFSQLSPADKLFYLFAVYEMYGVNKTQAIDLTEFFDQYLLWVNPFQKHSIPGANGLC